MKKEYVEHTKTATGLRKLVSLWIPSSTLFSNIDFQTDTEARPGRGTGK